MAAFTTTDPRGISVVSWADANSLLLEQYGTVGRLEDPAEWRNWATSALAILSSHGITVPNPLDFAEWSAWAAAFNLCVDAVQ